MADDRTAGFARLHIVSFDKLASLVFKWSGLPQPALLGEEGRIMALGAILARTEKSLRLFGTSARRPGFARELSGALRELQQFRLGPAKLAEIAEKPEIPGKLRDKLIDLALLLREYTSWLEAHSTRDADCLLDLATEAVAASPLAFRIEELWLDGFGMVIPQERKLLATLLPQCGKATFAFCLEEDSAAKAAWHSPWSVIQRAFHQLRDDLALLPDSRIVTEVLPRDESRGRFATSPGLGHLERHWGDPWPFPGPSPEGVRIAQCPNPEGEAAFAAREILRFVRAGGRFRDIAVLVRDLEPYHDVLRRAFLRFAIPFFLDRRETVAHHPLAELTRGALRTMAFAWTHEALFSTLKSGLFNLDQKDIDWLENEALSRGWRGADWRKKLPYDGDRAGELETLRQTVVASLGPLDGLAVRPPSGDELASALAAFWKLLDAEEILARWNRDTPEQTGPHATVWAQMQMWLSNIRLAFGNERMALREWLPVLEAGLGSLTVGVIPPALDQVLIGAVDRSRNPDLRVAIVLGMNESVFPAVLPDRTLLSEPDRERLENRGVGLAPGKNLLLGQERFFGYIACTRPRESLLLTYSQTDADGGALNPSYFVAHLLRLFPDLQIETPPGLPNCWDAEHSTEFASALLEGHSERGRIRPAVSRRLSDYPAFRPTLARLEGLKNPEDDVAITPATAELLYGTVMETSVSRLEQFAACPFRFFVNSGLGAKERLKFEYDTRQQGSFQHEVLSRFHTEIIEAKEKWRDLTGAEAAQRIARIARDLIGTFEKGLLTHTDENRFVADSHVVSLQRLIGTLTEWARQNEFEPAGVEIGFSESGPLPAWRLDLPDGKHSLAFGGRIDRIDLRRNSGGTAHCIVLDYKSTLKKLDRTLLAHGIQQQLPAYLNALRRIGKAAEVFHAAELIPAGLFYVNLRGKFDRGENRRAVLDSDSAQKEAYRHNGMFDFGLAHRLDTRPGADSGDQFNYRVKTDGTPYANCDAVDTGEFLRMLDDAEKKLVELGARIFRGDAAVDPYKKGKDTACDTCEYQSVCRIDAWTHPFRPLAKAEKLAKTKAKPGRPAK